MSSATIHDSKLRRTGESDISHILIKMAALDFVRAATKQGSIDFPKLISLVDFPRLISLVDFPWGELFDKA